jgi:hypothetical protein
MVALSRCGQRGDELEAYRSARRVLVEELGVEPGPELRDTHERILVGTLDADGPPTAPQADAPGTAGPRPSASTPRQLPASVQGFTGRKDALHALDALLDGVTAGATLLLITAVAGTAGIGKTALAVHWATVPRRGSRTVSSM